MLATLAAAVASTVWAASAAVDPDASTFVPVTDAMLQDPDPADWLSWRRTTDGHGYSPLDQITRDNVASLRAYTSAPGCRRATTRS